MACLDFRPGTMTAYRAQRRGLSEESVPLSQQTLFGIDDGAILWPLQKRLARFL